MEGACSVEVVGSDVIKECSRVEVEEDVYCANWRWLEVPKIDGISG